MKLWAGQTVSELGSVVTRTAVPLVALLVLGAGPTQMAFIVVSASLAVLLVGFFAGAWVDRLRRRPLMILSDVLRAGLLFSIPVAYVAGSLRMEQLYIDVELEPAPLGSLVEGVADRRPCIVRQLVEAAQQPHPDPLGTQLVRLIADRLAEQLEQPRDLVVGARPVLAAE